MHVETGALLHNPANPEVNVRCAVSESTNSPAEVLIDFRDNGGGFVTGMAENAARPFFSTPNMGLGLSVAKNVVSGHHGSLEIRMPAKGESGCVRIHLPLAPHPTNAQTSLSE